MDKSFWLIGLHTLFLGIVLGNVQGDMVCLQENVVLRWDIWKHSKLDYAYIKHGRVLILTIGPLTNIIIEDEFKSQVEVIITESLQIEMTIFNVTKATNGTYTCTIGKHWEQDLIIEKKLSVIDPDITLSLDTDYNDCKTLNCSSKYKVALLGPDKTEPKSDTCLFKEHNGMYSCCLVNQSMCSSTYCKYIDVKLDEHNDIYHSRNTEKTTPSNDLDKQNIGFIVGLIVATVTILILLAIIIGLIRRIIITKRVTYKQGCNDQTVSARQKELEDLIQQQRSNCFFKTT